MTTVEFFAAGGEAMDYRRQKIAPRIFTVDVIGAHLGCKWGFRCPLGCGRKTKVLFRRYSRFGCMKCQNLTHPSSVSPVGRRRALEAISQGVENLEEKSLITLMKVVE